VGFLSALSGNAGEIDPIEAALTLQGVLIPHETVEKAYQVGRDLFAFTERRLILVDKQGFSGSKIEYHSIPYRSITHFAIETAGPMDLDAELKIWVAGTLLPIQREFNKKVNVYAVQSLLATRVL
jgi:Bacterial PH domain